MSKISCLLSYSRCDKVICDIYIYIQCVQKVAVHLGYSRVQLKCDGTRSRTGGEARKVAVHL